MKAAIQGQKKRLSFWIKLGILALAILGTVFFLHHKKEALIIRCSAVFQSLFKRQTELDVRIEKISGNLMGSIKFQGVRVEAPWLPEEVRTLFQAEQIRIQYRFLDFLSKKYDSKITVTVVKPVVVWVPRLRLKWASFPFFGWMREWALSGLQNLVLNVEGLDVYYGSGKKHVEGIDATITRDSFRMEVPLTHMNMAGFDVTSVLHAEGRFEPALSDARNDLIRGQITTEGTVVNWKPFQTEASFDFLLESNQVRVTADNFLGGFEILAKVDFEKDFWLEASVKALSYPLSNINPFLGVSEKLSLPAQLDLEAELSGVLWEPHMTLRARLHEGRVGKKTFKALDLNGSGVYPTIRLTDSKILMTDGTTMRFAEKALEVSDFFKNKIFEKLISEAQQEEVVWGDWGLSRPKDSNDLSEFMMERVLGDNASIHFRKYNEDKEKPINLGTVEPAPMEVGFEYQLEAKDSLKVELRENEEFVGIERKMKF